MSKKHAEKLLLLFLTLMISGYVVSGCAASGLRTATPPNALPDISHRWPMDNVPAHQGISIGGRGEIVAPAEGVVVFSRGTHVRIHHGLDSNKHDIYTDHYHVYGGFIRAGDRVQRGQTLGSIGVGRNVSVPHYHYVVIKEESSRKSIPLNPNDYWFGIDQYKEKLERGLDVGPFVIPCFDSNVIYPKEPIRFTYPARCK